MSPVDTEYYDLLGVPTDVNETDLKKAYRKAAIKWHPDKNKAPDAEEKFKDICEAFRVLSDPNLRAVYDRNGKSMLEKEDGAVGVDDAAQFFANVFGGERFMDYIGEISLIKEMTSTATALMTEEEKEELEKGMNGGPTSPTVSGAASPAGIHDSKPGTPAPGPTRTTSPLPTSPSPAPASAPTTATTPDEKSSASHKPAPQRQITENGEADSTHAAASRDRKGKHKLTPEQKKKLEEMEKERKKAMEERIKTLTDKLIERLRPFVDAKHPGDKDDPETVAFEQRMHREAEDMKFESFGVELLHAIGTVYITKATSFMKSRKFLGIPGFFSRLKEKGAVAKDAWGVIGSALSVQSVMQEMERMQAKGEIPEEEMRAFEMDMTGKIMLASWRGTRFEVVQVLREVCDNVLKEPGMSEAILVNRAKGLLLMGAIFKATEPDESAEERRELERMVAEAGAGKTKRKAHREQALKEKANGDEATTPLTAGASTSAS